MANSCNLQKWTCCNNHPAAPPCKGEEYHAPRQYVGNELKRNWQFYHTPPTGPESQNRAAVVIDCEMGVAESGECELIRVSAVDYFSRATLLDSLVWPDVAMKHYNTRYSGVSKFAMQNARRRRSCIFGRNNARKAVCKFVGPDTIVVGHAANADLTSLRWIHSSVVDTLLIEKNARLPEKPTEKADGGSGSSELAATAKAIGSETEQPNTEEPMTEEPKTSGGCSLKFLALERLGRTIQIRRKGHDSLEDATATRDLLHWHISRTTDAENS